MLEKGNILVGNEKHIDKRNMLEKGNILAGNENILKKKCWKNKKINIFYIITLKNLPVHIQEDA